MKDQLITNFWHISYLSWVCTKGTR